MEADFERLADEPPLTLNPPSFRSSFLPPHFSHLSGIPRLPITSTSTSCPQSLHL
jgi:hypothetical protein